MLFLVVGVGCAKQPPSKQKYPPKKPPVAKPVPPPVPPMPPSLNPRRDASQKMVQMGEAYLENNDLDKATQTFQEAINIDSENGVAYYFFAKALYQKGSCDEALGVLDRAEVLLGSNPDWMGEVLRLKVMVEELRANPPEEQKPPSADVGYY